MKMTMEQLLLEPARQRPAQLSSGQARPQTMTPSSHVMRLEHLLKSHVPPVLFVQSRRQAPSPQSILPQPAPMQVT